MDKLTTSDWVQIIAAFAIIASIGLVLLEMRQGREVALAQLISDQHALQGSLLHAMLGEDGAKVMAKACDHPGELTRDEIEVLDAWIQSKELEIMRLRSISRLTGFYDEDLEWEAVVRANLYMILGIEYGRHVWRDDPRDLSAFPEVIKIADEVLEEIGDGCLWYDDHPKYLEQLGDDTS